MSADGGGQRSGEAVRAFGSEATGTEAKQAEALLIGYLDARAVQDWSSACDLLARSSQRFLSRVARNLERIKGESCAAAMASLTNRLPPPGGFAAIKPKSVRIARDRGYVLYTTARDAVYAIPITREDGEWRVGALNGRSL